MNKEELKREIKENLIVYTIDEITHHLKVMTDNPWIGHLVYIENLRAELKGIEQTEAKIKKDIKKICKKEQNRLRKSYTRDTVNYCIVVNNFAVELLKSLEEKKG